jgi:hypothetical protein
MWKLCLQWYVVRFEGLTWTEHRLFNLLNLVVHERCFGTCLQWILDHNILRLQAAGAIWRHKQHDNERMVLLHPAAVGLTDVHRPAVNQPKCFLHLRQPQLLPFSLAVRRDDEVGELILDLQVGPVVLSLSPTPITWIVICCLVQRPGSLEGQRPYAKHGG